MHGPYTIMHGRGVSNKMHHQLQPKETYLRCKAVLAVTITAKGVTHMVTRRVLYNQLSLAKQKAHPQSSGSRKWEEMSQKSSDFIASTLNETAKRKIHYINTTFSLQTMD